MSSVPDVVADGLGRSAGAARSASGSSPSTTTIAASPLRRSHPSRRARALRRPSRSVGRLRSQRDDRRRAGDGVDEPRHVRTPAIRRPGRGTAARRRTGTPGVDRPRRAPSMLGRRAAARSPRRGRGAARAWPRGSRRASTAASATGSSDDAERLGAERRPRVRRHPAGTRESAAEPPQHVHRAPPGSSGGPSSSSRGGASPESPSLAPRAPPPPAGRPGRSSGRRCGPSPSRSVTSPRARATSSMNGSHRSRLATGFFWRVLPAPREPALPPAVAEAVHDVGRVADDLERAVDRLGPPRSAAVISMRWLVVVGLGPTRTPRRAPPTPSRPGPGFPLHAPSVYTTVAPSTPRGGSTRRTPSPVVRRRRTPVGAS